MLSNLLCVILVILCLGLMAYEVLRRLNSLYPKHNIPDTKLKAHRGAYKTTQILKQVTDEHT